VADILELRTQHEPVERGWLTVMGFCWPLHFQVLDQALGKSYSYAGIFTSTSLLARHRTKGVYVVSMLEGQYQDVEPGVWALECLLNSLVVQRIKKSGDHHIAYVIFDDRSRWEIRANASACKLIWEEAVKVVEGREEPRLTTYEVAVVLAPKMSDRVQRIRLYNDEEFAA
jgi:hypothetical protein